ncbi:glycosyltransferase family 2 protein [Taklimakanibacter lacteus]|uniref:glycosyltransferase family 2 protein n=1 Tax=Taklimakanibacter lacteus TaxID=2268456 RepID=UPI0013C52057
MIKLNPTLLSHRRERTLFQGFWHGAPLGPLLRACLASFIKMGHRFDLYCYDKVAVPPGVRLRDANKIIPRSELFYWDNPMTGKSEISPFSDLFRFKLLSERGGWWSDVDAICLSSDIPEVSRAWAQEKPEREAGALGSSQIAFPAGDSMVLELYRRCLENCRAGTLRHEIGPDLISDLVREQGLPTDLFGTPDTFYPIRWIEMFKLWLPQFRDEVTERANKALFLPIYGSFPQYIGLELVKLPPQGSFLCEICDRYLADHRDLPHYTAEEIEVRTRAFMIRHEWALDELAMVAGEKTIEKLGIKSKWAKQANRQVTDTPLAKIDTRRMQFARDEVLCVVGMRNELLRLPYFLEYHRKLGVDRFLCMDNGSDDGTTEYLLDQEDCHCFHTEGSHFANNIDPPNWSNAVLNAFCKGHWCVVIDGDELLVYPGSENVSLQQFCGFLGDDGADAMSASMIDMYADGPASDFTYRQGESFVETAPYFDPKPGWLRPISGVFPPIQMYGGVRERLFWRGRNSRPPCLTKVPLVKWRDGMRYLVAQHLINQAELSPVTGALLHFKFLTGFHLRTEVEVLDNAEVEEKSLEEREAYLAVIKKQPNLTIRNSQSVEYRNSEQLVDLGWTQSSPAFDKFRLRSDL